MLIKSPTKLESWLRQTLRVRPSTGAANPERNDERYCTYCTRHTNYGYRPAYVEQLVRKCSTAAGFTRLAGKPAHDKVTGALVEEQPIEEIPAASKREHHGSADDRTSA